MRTNCITSALAKVSHVGVFAVLLSCIAVAGCGDFCVTGVINPGGGIVTGTGNSCPVPKPTGNVELQLNSSTTATPTSWPSDVQHIFVSLRGIEAFPENPSGEDSPAWQDLVPDLATQPVQVDLMAREAGSCGSSAFPKAVIDAGVYRDVRLRLVSNHPDASEPVPAENACGKIGFNCIVAANGAKRPLVFSDPTELRIPPDGIVGGFFRVLPDDEIHLAIEFEPRGSFILSAGGEAQLLPNFSVAQQSLCESDSQ